MNITGTHFPIWLVVVYVMALSAILAWPIFAFTSIFAFDAPGSSSMPSTYVAVGIALCYPVLPLVGVLVSFLTYKKGRKTPAYIAAGLALLPFILIAVILVADTATSLFLMLGGKL